jgi:hypothetical protein
MVCLLPPQPALSHIAGFQKDETFVIDIKWFCIICDINGSFFYPRAELNVYQIFIEASLR